MAGVASIIGLFKSFQKGLRLIDGGDLQQLVQNTASGNAGITAHAGGGQASAVLLQASINRVETVASGADSVMLPPAIAGREVCVVNAGANALAVFPYILNPFTGVADTQAPNNGSGQVGTAFSLAAGNTGFFVCPTPGQWKSTLST